MAEHWGFGNLLARFSLLSVSPSLLIPSDPESLGVRAGLTLFIVLVALIVGPRLASGVGRVPALIETARERRAGLVDGDDEDSEAGAADAAPAATEHRTGSSRWLRGVVLFCIWVFALYLIAGVWFADSAIAPDERTNLLRSLHEFVIDLGISLLITILALVVARALQKSLVASLQHGRVNRNLVLLAGRTIFTITVLVGIVAILGIWGLGIALPVTLIGGLTVALSFALQDILKNLVSGVYLLLERPFVIGDQITIAPYTGVVENIYIRVTALRTSGGQRVLVPNGLLFSSAVVNNSFYQRRRVGLLVTLPDDDAAALAAARQRILDQLNQLPNVLRTPAPDVALSKASGGKVDLRAVFWLPVTREAEMGSTVADAMAQVRASLPGAEVAPLDLTLLD